MTCCSCCVQELGGAAPPEEPVLPSWGLPLIEVLPPTNRNGPTSGPPEARSWKTQSLPFFVAAGASHLQPGEGWWGDGKQAVAEPSSGRAEGAEAVGQAHWAKWCVQRPATLYMVAPWPLLCCFPEDSRPEAIPGDTPGCMDRALSGSGACGRRAHPVLSEAYLPPLLLATLGLALLLTFLEAIAGSIF